MTGRIAAPHDRREMTTQYKTEYDKLFIGGKWVRTVDR